MESSSVKQSPKVVCQRKKSMAGRSSKSALPENNIRR